MAQSKPPSSFTAAQNASVAFSFDDVGDYDRANRGLVAQIDPPQILAGPDALFPGRVVHDVAAHAFVLESDAPDSVHPGLWRQAQLNQFHGLFEVTEGVWQVRGYDIANITFIEGDDGWLVIDPLMTKDSAAAALDLANRTLGDRPVTTVIYTHSHPDHFGGVLGVTSQEAVDAGEVQIVAPDGFIEEIINEFVIGGPVMMRRAAYQFGPLLQPGPLGHVDCGLGSKGAWGPSDVLAPTHTISRTGEEMTLSGVRVVFQNTPDAEAPAEMNFYFPDKRLLCMAENCTHTLHNTYPIRGAQTRNALAWSKYIQEAMDLWADVTDTMIASHHWPRFGQDDVRGFLTLQRDVYRWMHDQTMRLANQGHVPTEIAAELTLPDEFSESHVQGYYGTVSHNVRSIYNFYLGWYDGNPANLNPLPPVDASARYVEFMGGADEVLRKARASFDEGDYRWVATVVNHVVFADPANAEARGLQADALEQLGYQSESATWRNAYLTGAQELRDGTPDFGAVPRRDMSKSMRPEHLVDSIGVRYDPTAFTRGPVALNLHFTDLDEDHVLGLGRSAVYHHVGTDADAVATIRLDRSAVVRALHDPTVVDEFEIEGDREIVSALFDTLTIFGTPAIIEP